MDWQIRITKTAQKQIAALDKGNQHRIINFLRERLSKRSNPYELGNALQGNKASLWRYRVGDYRLICTIEKTRQEIAILAVGHRREVYK